MTLVRPREFLTDYVEPATELYRINRLLKHLATHAIAEMDNLAEVTANFTLLGGRTMLAQGEANRFREAQQKREPVLGIIRDAHDSHKHGRLGRADASHKAYNPQGAAEGRRPETANRAGFFVGRTPIGRPLTRCQVLIIRLNDGSEQEVYQLLWNARQAWDREFDYLGI